MKDVDIGYMFCSPKFKRVCYWYLCEKYRSLRLLMIWLVIWYIDDILICFNHCVLYCQSNLTGVLVLFFHCKKPAGVFIKTQLVYLTSRQKNFKHNHTVFFLSPLSWETFLLHKLNLIFCILTKKFPFFSFFFLSFFSLLQLTLNVRSLPTLSGSESYSCVFTNPEDSSQIDSLDAVIDGSNVTCSTPSLSRLPPSLPGKLLYSHYLYKNVDQVLDKVHQVPPINKANVLKFLHLTID